MRPALVFLLASTLVLPAAIPAACAAPGPDSPAEAAQGDVSWSIEARSAPAGEG